MACKVDQRGQTWGDKRVRNENAAWIELSAWTLCSKLRQVIRAIPAGGRRKPRSITSDACQ
ncbi:hypothetical protein [Escherichia coli]|uniref:hypothetical protein n=1 Tax=Escherichia coli TaxID=562 RepID=UPI000B251711|nr:hypothetical protein [Escherichia coli]